MKLYEIAENYNGVLDMVDDPEIDQQTVTDTLEAIKGEFEVKLENCGRVIKNRNAEADAISAEIERLTARKRRIEESNRWLKGYMLTQMEAVGRDKVKTELFSFSKARNSQPSVVVTDEKLIPEDYYVVKMPELSKTALKEALTRGIEVPGAKLEQGYHLNIR